MWNKPRLFDVFRGRPLLSLLLALATGIICAQFIPAARSVAIPMLLAGVAAALLFLTNKTHIRRMPPLLLLTAALGVFICAGQNAALDTFPARDGDFVSITGRVQGVPDSDKFRLRVESVDGIPVSCADIYVYSEGYIPAPGSSVIATGEVFAPDTYGNTSSFDYNAYLRRQGIAAMLSSKFGGEVRLLAEGPAFSPAGISAWMRDCLDEAALSLSPEQRTLVYGVFLGEKSGLDYQTRESMALAGMLHLFAVSGLHVGYIVSFALLLAGSHFRRRGLRFMLAACFLLVYAGLTGAVASVMRAIIMAFSLLLGDLLIEENDSVSGVSLAALLCLLYRPLWLFDAGFQLSFTAIFGLIVWQPFFFRLLRSLPHMLRSAYAAACAASLFTMPLLAYYYYHISWLGWLLSPLAVLAAALAVTLCFISLPFVLFFPALAAVFLAAAGYVMQALSAAASFTAALPPAASTVGAIPALLIACFYLLLLMLPYAALRLRPAAVSLLIATLMLLIALLPPLLREWRSWPDGAICAVTFIDVGQGDAALIQLKSGETMLIDGGGRAAAPGSIGEYVLLPELKSRGIRSIDLVVSSHPDIDHSDGLLSVLSVLDVGCFMYADCFPENAMQQELLLAAAGAGSELLAVSAGESFRLGEALSISVCHPPMGYAAAAGEENDASLILRLSCGETDFLFTGDAGGGALADLAQAGLRAEIVKLPHHGSKTGYDEVFYRDIGAEAVVFSAGRNNSYGHPAADVLEYWQDKAEIYRTDINGAVTIISNGRNWTARTEWN